MHALKNNLKKRILYNNFLLHKINTLYSSNQDQSSTINFVQINKKNNSISQTSLFVIEQ